ncbi:SdrD B-like domain-containing protein, partial [Methylobacterium sp. Leaf465]|uniref:MSCRAMM family protein n=1 Tax=Methylobacterium sp. Leaf465 TaxID=1736385 RepID=UPI000A874C0F
PGQTAQDLAVTGIDLTNATLAGTDGSPVTLAGFTTAMPGTLTIDTTAPSLALTQIPAVTIQATSAAGAAVTFAATATDGVDGTDPVTFREGTTVVASGQTFGLGPHTLTATATDAAGNATTRSFSFTVAPPDPARNATLAGTVFSDTNANRTRDPNDGGLAGFGVELLAADGSGAPLATTISDATGGYSFANLAAGSYAVRFTPGGTGYIAEAGTAVAGGKTLVTNVTAANDTTTPLDEGFYKLGSIVGLAYDDANGNGKLDRGEASINGVAITLFDASGRTVATTVTRTGDPASPSKDGIYSFANLTPGNYYVEAVAPGGKAVTGPETLFKSVGSGATLASSLFSTRDVATSVSLSGTMYADADGNGRQDPGDAGLAGVDVVVLNAAGYAVDTTVTDRNGAYSFRGLNAGTYEVVAATPQGLKGSTATSLSSGSLTAGQSATQLDAGFKADPVTDHTGAIPASTTLNVIVRGQSNTYFPSRYGDMALMQTQIQTLLGFDGVNQKVNVVATNVDATKDGALTEWPGTGMLTDWLTPVNGDYTQGWNATFRELGLLSAIGKLPASQQAAPTAVVWLHNENDSQFDGITPAMWESAARYEAGLVRGVLGQDAGTVPYLFVNAIPFVGQTTVNQSVNNQTIRVGQAELAEDKGFNAGYAARQASDVDMDVNASGFPSKPGDLHVDRADGAQIFSRVALSIAETFRASALPGSPLALASGDIDNDGPRVVRAERVAGAPDQLLLTVAFDQATSLKALGSVAAAGTGWSLRADWNAAASQALATRAELVDASHMRLTFDRDVPAATELFYGWGGARIALPGQPGIGAAIYDDNDLPLWVDPRGLAVSQAVTQAGPIAVQSIADSG